MKKFLSLLLAIMMLLSCLPAMADDAEWKINQYTQLVARKSAAEKIENIVVPAEVGGVAVRGVEYMAFNMYKNFKTLTIADSAVMLDRRVVRDLPKLEAIDLPENLLVIREGNFTNVPMLTNVVIPASVAVVHSSFNSCKNLTSITFEGMCPVFVTEGEFGMFTDLPADCVIYVPDNQVDVYKAAFADREDVVARIQPSGANAYSIDWTAPESDFVFDAATGTITGYTGTANYLKIPAAIGGVQVKSIGNDAFVKCHSICFVVIPEGVETVGDWAFAGISMLSCVSLPSTLVSMGSSAFSSAYMSAIAFNGDAVPTYAASAFGGFKGSWQLILPYGSTQEYVDAFAAYLAPVAATGVVKASIIEPYKFPTLDTEAGAPFIGNWNAVAVTDGTDFYGMDLLGISMNIVLNADGTGALDMDGDVTAGGWYVENGNAIFAPILEEGGQPVPEEAIPFTLDENGRMGLDLMGLIVLMEKEGMTYAVPAIPEKPWPEFDLANAKYFIGQWEAIEYIVEGESYPVEMIGPMAVSLNDDGSALLVEGEEEPYELRWYAEYAVAYMGETMSDRVEITFDGNGNIKLDMLEVVVILAPKEEEIPAEPEAPEAPAVESNTILGNWDDGYKTLDIYEDGRMDLTYKSDGYVNSMEWAMVDGVPTVTKGMWKNIPIKVVDGLLIIEKDTLYQEFERVGAAPDTYVGDDEGEEAMLVAQPIGAEGAAYFGLWNLESMMGMSASFLGMTMDLTLNEDGTCSIFDGYENDWAVWTVENGVAMVDGAALTINADGALVMDQEGVEMIFVKADGAAPSAPEAPANAQIDYVPSVADDFIGGWICKVDPELQILLLEGEANLIDGNELYTVDWSVVNGVAEFDGMKLYITESWTTGILDMYGDLVEFERGYVEKPKASAAAPGDSDDDEMTDEELLALLMLLGQLAEGDDTDLPENLKPYVGTWHMVYIATGGLEGDLRPMGITAKLELNADGTGKLSGAADDSGKWYDDEGTVRFGKAGTALVLLDGGFLRYGSQLAGYMVFSQDATASWTPAPAVVATSAPVAPAAPQAPVASGNVQYVGQKFICKTYTTFGMTMDASMLGAEYSLKFAADNTAEFTMAGFAVPALPYTVNAEGVYVINYYGTMFNCVPTATGFDMDYYGTMTMHFVPAE